MIVSDTDFLSALAKIDKIDLIFSALKTNEIMITEAVYEEIKQALVFDKLLPYLSSKKIKVVSVSTKDMPANLGNGEKESISFAKDKKSKLLMDDRKAGRYAENKDVSVIDIPSFLFYCKQNGILSASEIKNVISKLKEKDFYEFEKGIVDELVSESE